VTALKRKKKRGNGNEWDQFRKEPSLKFSGKTMPALDPLQVIKINQVIKIVFE